MAYLGEIKGSCGEEQVFSGRENCEVIPDKTIALEIHAPSVDYPADPTEFLAGYQGYHTATDSTRLIVIKTISGNEPTGGDFQTSESGNYGNSTTVGVNSTTVAYQIENGTPCLFKELSKLNLRTMRIFHDDAQGMQFGAVRENSSNQLRRRGYLGKIYVREVEATGTTPYQLWFNIDYSQEYESEKKNRDGILIGVQNIPDGLKGLKLVNATGAGQARVMTNCGGTDVTQEFSGDWDTTMFINEAGGNPTTVTEADGVLTFAPTSAAYKVADAEKLLAGGIEGYEGVNTYVQIS